MTLLQIIGMIVAGFALLVLAVLLFLLFAPMTFHIKGTDQRTCLKICIGIFKVQFLYAKGENGISLNLKIGFFQKQLYPYKKKKRPSYPIPEKKLEQKPERNLPFSLGDCLEMLEKFRDKLKIRILTVEVLIGTGDAALTGMILGGCAAVLGVVLPYLEQNFTIRKYHIAVDGDFDAAATKWDIELLCVTYGITACWILWSQFRLLNKHTTDCKNQKKKDEA